MSQLQRTALTAWHASHGARLVDFAGWEMPVQYTSIVEEHHAVRKKAGLFDIAHMGRLYFTGPDAQRFLSHLLTIDAGKLDVGQVKYGLVVTPEAGILDDILLYRLADRFLLVVNASNRPKIVEWIAKQSGGFHFTLDDRTPTEFMLALQGPLSEQLLQPHTPGTLRDLGYYRVREATVCGVKGLLSRTGYTGEDGFELIIPVADAERVWQRLADDMTAVGGKAAGLGCRDTLRLEAAMPLYGHELDEQTDPYTAGLAFGVNLEREPFIGQDALRTIKQAATKKKRVGLVLDSRRIAREQTPILQNGVRVGTVTSGTFSPTLEKSIAMGYVAPSLAPPGTPLELDIRGKLEPAQVVKLPFYKRP